MAPQEWSEKQLATPIVASVEDSHRRIRRDLKLLSESAKVSEIGSIADELVALLKNHFQDEEKPGGLFEELESLQPAVDSQLEALRAEHRQILQMLEDLRRQTREGRPEQPQDPIRASAAAFVELIHHHERIESHLVSEAYYTEDGGRG